MSRHPALPVESVEVDGVLDVLMSFDEVAAVAWIDLRRRHVAPVVRVNLVMDECSPEDALAFARALYEMGRPAEALEVIRAVLTATLGVGGAVQDERVASNRPDASLSDSSAPDLYRSDLDRGASNRPDFE